MVPDLARHFRVLRMDLRGLGRSGRDFDALREITLDNYVADLLALVQHLGAAPVHLCGESIGGIICAAFAARYPQHVHTLTLISTPAFLRPQARLLYACGHDTPAQAMQALGTAEWLRRTNGSTRFPPDMPQPFLDWFNGEVGNADPDVLIGMSAFILNGNIVPELSGIRAPTLLIYPEAGTTASDDQCAIFLTEIPNSRVVRVPTPYHMVHLIQPHACCDAILDFALANPAPD